jgi:anti-anti-sigma factor
MSAIRYIDSTGMKALVDVYKLSQERGHHFVLAAPSDIVHKVLTTVKVDKVIPTFQALQDAVNSLSSLL